jgi:hypothetical protein
MQIELFRLFSGEVGHDFVIYDGTGIERFSARLMQGSAELFVLWTDDVPRTVLRLRDVQKLAGGTGAIVRIVGLASDLVESAIMTGTFDEGRAARLLSRALGGNWRVQALPRAETRFRLWDIVADRIGE